MEIIGKICYAEANKQVLTFSNARCQAMILKTKKNILIICGVVVAIVAAVFLWGVYVPEDFGAGEVVRYEVKPGAGASVIARDLAGQGIVRSAFFFKAYIFLAGTHGKLQAGTYEISPAMSIAKIADKISDGDVVKNTVTLIEGWDIKDIETYLADTDIFSKKDFDTALAGVVADDYDFLKDKPKKLGLEGYIFPDTYYVPVGSTAGEFVRTALQNFDKKLTPELRTEIAHQKKSIFEIITMASIIEKEVRSQQDKKMVSGILWKRIDNGMGLAVDSSINYITGRSDASVTIKDTQIDSPYNTYKYRGLPLGPISNPGLESIMAAIYPEKSAYWYYLSAKKTGETIFSKTLEEHNAAVQKYLR